MRGAPWNPSTIHGNPPRGTGILNNELYVGRLVWNRLRYGYVMYWRDRLACFGARSRGTCTNRLTISRQEVEERVLVALRDKLLRRDLTRTSAESTWAS